jgi:hypothetical protein
MKRLKHIIVCAMFGLVSCMLARAADSNPYTMIAARNVFSLVQPEIVVPPPAPETPLPQVTVNGIMTVFGRPQVLFKMTIPASPGTKARELYFVLGEGELEEGVTISKINITTGIVTFNNQGTLQQIPLANRQ